MSRTATKQSPHAVTVERTLESTGSTIRVVLEPLPERQVLIVEYRRRRKPEGRFERVRGEEGKSVPYDLLNLEQDFEALFPQAGLFEEKNGKATTEAKPRKARRARR